MDGNLLMDKLTNKALVTPTPGLSTVCIQVIGVVNQESSHDAADLVTRMEMVISYRLWQYIFHNIYAMDMWIYFLGLPSGFCNISKTDVTYVKEYMYVCWYMLLMQPSVI